MFVEMKTFTVQVGSADQLLTRFSNPSVITEQEGFIDLVVMKKVRRADHEEVVILARWESQEHFTNWKRSDAHQGGHKTKKERPEYMIDVKMETYEVKTIKAATK